MTAKSPNPIDIHVGSRVRMRRNLVGYSQEKLGELLGLTFQQVQKYEKGTNRVSASRLYQISKILNVPVQYFYDDLPNEIENSKYGFAESATPAPVMDFLSSSEGLQLNKAFASIEEPSVRKKVVELVKAIAGNPSSLG